MFHLDSVLFVLELMQMRGSRRNVLFVLLLHIWVLAFKQNTVHQKYADMYEGSLYSKDN